MRRWLQPRTLLLAGMFFALTGAARADAPPDLDHINVWYHGGPLLQQVRVCTLFWGRGWDQTPMRPYFNRFLQELFADGRYMANLAQYGTLFQPIENGSLAASAVDTQQPPARVTDAQIRREIRAQIAAGHLPRADDNTLYVVFTAPGVVVIDAEGNQSGEKFIGYHDYSFDDGFAYAPIPYTKFQGDAHPMTMVISHELAEAVTDPEPYDDTLGWYDDNNGEIADIPVDLANDSRIGPEELYDYLRGLDGTTYVVQKVWSVADGKPVAFAGQSRQLGE